MNLRSPFVLALALLLPAAALAAGDEDWPREIETAKGLVVLYQPQVDVLEGDALSARAAVSVKPTGQDEPIFGAVWLEARIDTDFEARIVTLEDARVPQVRFQDATDEQQQELAELLTAEIPAWDIELSLDKLMASLEIAEQQSLAATNFDDSPPVILFTDEPTVLISIDGEPRFQELEKTGVQTVINTPFLIAQDPDKTDRYYLYAGADSWYEARAVNGPWNSTTKVPKKIKQLEPEDEEIEPEDEAESPDKLPAIVVATESTELIVTDGQPQFLPLGDGSLLIIKNTESDVLRENTTQRIFVLLSGRWFAAKSTQGPWEFVPSDALPESFSEIDPDSDYGYLLTWVAGSELAEETSLDSYVPQTAAIKRNATIEVRYDGEPKFEPIEDTSLHYAVNTESQVIQAGSEYYCAEDGIWYVADDPKGPWRVATEVPDEIYT
ncbi:MAG: carbohydrate-binding family V/XII, partial [Acidobacteria bacterium]|nr:carbohydrate-binding family V/XII [Acidobacteriota bacterium]